jgi:hypothetical protein
MEASNRLGMGLLYRPARLHRLAESIPGLLRSLKIPSLAGGYDNPIPTRFLASTDCSKIPAQHRIYYVQLKYRTMTIKMIDGLLVRDRAECDQ